MASNYCWHCGRKRTMFNKMRFEGDWFGICDFCWEWLGKITEADLDGMASK